MTKKRTPRVESSPDYRRLKMLTFKINNRKQEDYIVIKGETIEEIRKIAKNEIDRRGWEEEHIWSEEV